MFIQCICKDLYVYFEVFDTQETTVISVFGLKPISLINFKY